MIVLITAAVIQNKKGKQQILVLFLSEIFPMDIPVCLFVHWREPQLTLMQLDYNNNF